jgi:hypothetical protein
MEPTGFIGEVSCDTNCSMLWLILLGNVVSAVSDISSTACPPDSFHVLPWNSTADYEIVLFNSGLSQTSRNNTRLDPSPCTNIHPQSKIVMVRSIAMGDFLATKFGAGDLWSGLFRANSSSDAKFGWEWMDGTNVSNRPIIWAQGEPNDANGDQRTAQWRYTYNPDGHVDLSPGAGARVICELWSRFSCFEHNIAHNLIRV